MFTGLIEEIGKIKNIESIPGGKRFDISAKKILTDLKIDHSVSVSGACLTAIKVGENYFTAEVVGETLQKTTLGELNVGVAVNLERAMVLGERLGGHLIQGHINGIGQVLRLNNRGDNWYLEVNIPEELQKYVINEGSIAVDGISLTIAHLEVNRVGLSIIPHTYANTIISNYSIGTKVNIEVDFIAKYIEKLIGNYVERGSNRPITEKWLKEVGF